MTKQYTVAQVSLWKSIFTISEGGQQVGQLEQTGLFRQRVSARLADQQWRFVKSSGLKESSVKVLPVDNDAELAAYRVTGFRQTGTIELHNTTYRFKVGTWKSRYEWYLEAGTNTTDQPIISYAMRGFLKRSGTIDVSDAALQSPDCELLVALGLYLGMDVEASNAASAGATVAAVSVATSS